MTKLSIALLSALFVCSTAHAAVLPVQDCLIGNGSTGPYQLSWSHITQQLVSVTLNGKDMVAGLDYTVNSDAGTVTFLLPVPSQSSVLVNYDYDTSTSTKVSASTSVPLQMNYQANGQSSLFMQGAVQNQGLTQLNLGAKTSETTKSTELSGQILYSAASTEGSNMADRLGASVHTQADPSKQTHLTLDWSDAGGDFNNSGNGSITPGDNHLQAAATDTLSKQLTATITHTQDNAGGVVQSTNVVTATATPNPNLKIGANVTQGGPTNQTATINAQAGLTKTLSVTASAVQTSQTDDHSQQQQIGVNVTPIKAVQLTGTLTTIENPQPIVLYGVGVSSTLGHLSLQSGYNQTESTTSPLLNTDVTVGVGMNLGHTSISANYDGNVATAPAQSAQQTQTYTLSVNHSITNRMVFSLNGSLTQATNPNTCQLAANYTTTANLGIKF